MEMCNHPTDTEETKQQPSHSVTARAWEKDYCDYLLDSIDAQLSQLEVCGEGPGKGWKSSYRSEGDEQ